MATKADRPPKSRTTKQRERRQQETVKPLPTWRNTHPRGNPEPDERDLERSRERFESLLGR